MRKARLRGLHDYMALIARRRWWVVTFFVALSALAVFFSLLLPKVYRSETMILIQPRDVPTDFVKDLIAGNTEQRLTSIEQTILSRTNLLAILREFEQRLPAYRGLNDDRKVLKLKNRIAIDFASERVRGQYLPITNLRIAYRDQNAGLAQLIAARLASLFIEQDSRAREAQVFGTTEFLQNELNKVSDQLKQSTENLRKLKERFRFGLPTELDTNLRTLDRLQLQKTSNLEALDRHLSMQMILERQISETPAMISRESANKPAAGAPAPDPLVVKYRQKEQELKELLLKAKETHPDVQQLRDELEQLKKEIPPAELAAVQQALPEPQEAVMVPNPVYQSLTAQLRQLKTEIDIREKEKKALEADMERITRLVQNTPGVEQEIQNVLHVNAGLTKQYEDLKGKLDQARLAESLESHQKGSQFVIIDPANYPLESITPTPGRMILIGLGVSLGLAIVAAWIIDGLNQKVWTQRELERLLQAPVLIEIPRMTNAGDMTRARIIKLAQAAVFVVCTGVYFGGLYYLYLRQNTILRILDPIIERITDRLTSA